MTWSPAHTMLGEAFAVIFGCGNTGILMAKVLVHPFENWAIATYVLVMFGVTVKKGPEDKVVLGMVYHT